MKYISEFEGMGNEKELDDKIAAVHSKVFGVTPQKKSKLSKLLNKVKKKKAQQRYDEKLQDQSDNKSRIESETTQDIGLSNTKIGLFNDSNKNVAANNEGNYQKGDDSPQTPDNEISNIQNIDDSPDDNLKSSKISIFSHNFDNGNHFDNGINSDNHELDNQNELEINLQNSAAEDVEVGSPKFGSPRNLSDSSQKGNSTASKEQSNNSHKSEGEE